MFGTEAAEADVSAAAGRRRDGRRLLPQRVRVRLGRARRQGRARCGRPTAASCSHGEKMWITNGGFADVFIIFAKVDGEQFTAFIVERAWPGVSSGKEEHKLGPARLVDDAGHPAGREGAGRAVLGEIGKGHKVAFNVLNFGRFKLGAMCVRRRQDAPSTRPRSTPPQRKQFGTPIAHVRRDQAQARRDDRARVRAREHDVSHRRPDR